GRGRTPRSFAPRGAVLSVHMLARRVIAAIRPLPRVGLAVALLLLVARPVAADDNTAATGLPSATISWSPTASLPTARTEAATAVVAGRMYVFGGFVDADYHATRRTDAYDPTTMQWVRRASMPEPITHAPAVVVDHT